jgi:hypothetical protein
MVKKFIQFWRGEIPLKTAFWEWTVIYGSLANLLTTIGGLSVLAANWSGWLALAIHVAPIPYNVAAVVAVWRSAARFDGSPALRDLARIGVIVWAAIASLA